MDENPALYGVFCGPIEQSTLRHMTDQLTRITSGKLTEAHILFQTHGGTVGDGIFLHNLLKDFPLHLTLYNGGYIESIGVVAYLGAKKRRVSAGATFMIHRTTVFQQTANAIRLKSLADQVARGDESTEAIIRGSTSIPDEIWSLIQHNDVRFSAKEAIEFGIAQEIADFSPPPGTRLYSF